MSYFEDAPTFMTRSALIAKILGNAKVSIERVRPRQNPARDC